MVAIGRGLMADPRILMLDEPSLGLAPQIVEEVFRIVREINASGVTVLLVEQNTQHTLKIAHRGLCRRSPAARCFLEAARNCSATTKCVAHI